MFRADCISQPLGLLVSALQLHRCPPHHPTLNSPPHGKRASITGHNSSLQHHNCSMARPGFDYPSSPVRCQAIRIKPVRFAVQRIVNGSVRNALASAGSPHWECVGRSWRPQKCFRHPHGMAEQAYALLDAGWTTWWRLTIGEGVRETRLCRRECRKTLCTRGGNWALSRGPSTAPLEVDSRDLGLCRSGRASPQFSEAVAAVWLPSIPAASIRLSKRVRPPAPIHSDGPQSRDNGFARDSTSSMGTRGRWPDNAASAQATNGSWPRLTLNGALNVMAAIASLDAAEPHAHSG